MRSRDACRAIILRGLRGGAVVPGVVLAECRRLKHPHWDATHALEELVQEGRVVAGQPIRDGGWTVPTVLRAPAREG